MEKPVGIIGGMGPFATSDLFNKIIHHTNTKKEQDHIPVIIYNHPQIPSRADAIFGEGPSPIKDLIATGKKLELVGTDFLVMPCHTAHLWFDELQSNLNTRMISLIENTFRVVNNDPTFFKEKILLLSSRMTLKSGLYRELFENANVMLVEPSEAEQDVITEVIQHVKEKQDVSSISLDKLEDLLHHYQLQGVKGIIGACTEIPLIFPYLKTSLSKIDPTLELAKRVIREKKRELL
ncbi:cysteate racemase [Oceanobacillus halotolerans]|uniref:aspartate/glutamate racemase family protein n=1 Tax=Oceanobacillus halotolerans TaxID=2663380 RepID=UPI0013D9C690|nr:amino acid racemase [Oceanobacillus halotolerans]